MGIADLVPGVSGGTIAFALGIHPELLKSLKTIRLQSLRHPSQVAWFLLSAIVLGVLTSLALGSHVIYYLLNHENYQGLLRALFLGLIIGSIFYCIRKVQGFNIKKALCLSVGIFFALSISFFNLEQGEIASYDVPLKIELPERSDVNNYDNSKKQLKGVSVSDLRSLLKEGHIDASTWVYSPQFNKYVQVDSCLEFNYNQYFDFKLMASGALAICAMLLPGISGSQILQLFGSYEMIIEAIATWTKSLAYGSFVNPSFWVLLNAGVGILLGIAIFSRFFIFLYRKFYDATLSLLVGFMIGSLPSLWPFWSVSHKVHLGAAGAKLTLQRVKPIFPSLFDKQTGFVCLMVILGFSILLFLERIEMRRTANDAQDEESDSADPRAV